ncbi:MAG: hypothetical protein ACOX8E_07725 [Ruminococcus sp.]|jgi:FMN phosphatase YigB (HAD superfamily)
MKAWVYDKYKKVRKRLKKRYPHERKSLYAKGSESALARRESPREMAERLMDRDVITFDVFDTLILRCVSHPADVFYLTGMKLAYPNFRKIRIQAEREARKRKGGSGEVTLSEIWDILEEECGIDKKQGMDAEWQTEKSCCMGNPYFLEVIRILQRHGKCLAVISDMYLNRRQIMGILHTCGYRGLENCFVSSEWGASKWRGDLYDVVRKELGEDKSYIHVGDQEYSDGRQAAAHLFETVRYANVNEMGRQYRAEDMSPVTGSIYRGLVNAHIHNKAAVFSREYEYGFIYGGLFVTGYCRFIHDYARTHNLDKILFLSRDGAVLMEAYKKMYPQEAERIRYAYWSRLAAVKITASHFKYEFFQRFLYHKVNHGFTIRQILRSMELAHLLWDLCESTNNKPDTLLTHRNVEKVKKYLMSRWEQILECYEEQRRAAGLYYREIIGESRRAAAVDIGWAGSGAIMLDYAVNHLWDLDCSITGIIAGTDSAAADQGDVSEIFLLSGRLVSYLYSQRENRDIWKFHDPARYHNLYWELLLGAPQGSLIGFYPDERGGYRCRRSENPVYSERIRRIHKGILDFTGQYLRTERRLGMTVPVSGRDACAPMLNICSPGNEKFMEELKELMDVIHIG